MILNIKYMISMRCINIVRAKLDKLNIEYVVVNLGTVELKTALPPAQRKSFGIDLKDCGFEILDKPKDKLIAKVYKAIADIVSKPKKLLNGSHSEYIGSKLGYSYTYLSNIFSEVTGSTIESAIINLKIEQAKEMLLYDSLSLTQIATKLHYKSVSHLCHQFKKVTGLTPSFFKDMKKRKPILIEDL